MMNKRRLSLLLVLLLSSILMNAQRPDHAARVRKFLEDGNCEGARKYYNNVLLKNQSPDSQLEREIEECGSTTKTFNVKGVLFTMKLVEGGTFQMGSNDYVASDDEQPVHSVTLDSYYLGETEVTQALWKAVMGNNPSYFHGDNLPVESVNYDDIVNRFIPELNRLTGKKFRLPTEAEWEFAARGGTLSRGYQYAGSDDIGGVAWILNNSGDFYLSGIGDDWDLDKMMNNNCKTHPVKTKRPNELELYDMSGNVWEWCSDRCGRYASGHQNNPKGPSDGDCRILRGGAWNNGANDCRVSFRGNNDASGKGYNAGFRLALTR